MASRIDEFRRAGVGVIAISMSSPEGVARYLAERQLPFPLLADPDRSAYAAFGLGRTSWLRLMRPRVVWGYLKFIARGSKLKRIPEGEDALQLGGDFLVDVDRRLLWARRSADPLDRPSVDELLRACNVNAG